MSYLHAMVALDLARERDREIEAAARHRWIVELIADERRAHPELHPARGRVLLAAILRRFGRERPAAGQDRSRDGDAHKRPISDAA